MIVLASQSLFRKCALDIIGVGYEIVPSNFDESSVMDENPYSLTKKLSEAKALETAKKKKAIIVASDLAVVLEERILEKPRSEEEAFEMLSSLSGKTFDIVTGLAVYNPRTKNMLSTVEKCSVTFRPLKESEIHDYIKRYPVLKCAGAFESDGLLRFAENISGNYNFHAGMPVNRLISFLRKQGVDV